MPKAHKRNASVEDIVKLEKLDSLKSTPEKRYKYQNEEFYGDEGMPEFKPSTSRGRKKSNSISAASVDNDDEENSGSRLAVPPKVMYSFCESLLKKSESANLKLEQKSGLTDLTKLIEPNEEILQNSLKPKDVQLLFRTLYNDSVSLRNVRLNEALMRVKDYMKEGKSVTRHPKFPHTPPSSYQVFVKRFNKTSFTITPELLAKYKDKNDPDTKASEEDAKEASQKYVNQLQKFLNESQDELLEPHIKYVEDIIKRTLKHLSTEKAKPKPKKETKSPTKMTAYDFFKVTKKEKWTDLPEEEREKKLRKRYDKLTDEQREIFQSLASNS